MPMDRKKYPADWEKLARAVKEEAGWKCEECGRQCYQPGEKCPDKRNVLTVSHKNHKPWDCRRENLQALCSGCHLRYDARHHAETRRKNMRRKEIEKRFDIHVVTIEQGYNIVEVKEMIKAVALAINEACGDSREKSVALTKLEEASMWAVQAIARDKEA